MFNSTLIPYLDEQLQTLRDRLPLALGDFDADAIHKSRVATRRIKAVAALAAEAGVAEPSLKRLNKVGKSIRAVLGPLRDGDVMLGHLANLPPPVAEGAAWVAGHLQARREDDRSQAQNELKVAKVLARLEKHAGVRIRLAEHPLPLEPMADSIRQQAAELQQKADAVVAGDAQQNVDVHAVRIDAKRLRYTLEMASAAAITMPADALKHFKRVQDALGEWHDYAVLADTAAALLSRHELALHDGPKAAAVVKLLEALLQQSDKALQSFGRQWQRNGRKLMVALQAVEVEAASPSPSTPGVEPA